MKFIVEPVAEELKDREKRITLCAQCSENPRFCDGGGGFIP